MTSSISSPDPGTDSAGDATPSRMLAAVMLTDIVASTQRVSEVGNQAWRTLLDQHDQLLRRHVADHHGQLLRTTGDGALCTFPDPAEALDAAAALHRDLAPLGLQLRIGVHLGEIELRGGQEIAGLAVHAAARIAAIAPPGQTLVSASVSRALLGSRHRFFARGRARLRGVPGRWSLYLAGPDARWLQRLQHRQRWRQLLGAMLVVAGIGAAGIVHHYAGDTIAERLGWRQTRPTVAVMPFKTLGGSDADGYFAVGMRQEIQTQLSRVSALTVIAAASIDAMPATDRAPDRVSDLLGASHLVEASVQRSEGRVHVLVQLIQARDQRQIWAEAYDRDVADAIGVQSDVARGVARALHATLSEGEQRSLALRTTSQPAAYDAYLQGLATITRGGWGEPDMRRAARHFEQAVAIDSSFLQAWSQLSRTLSSLYMAYDRSEAVAARAREAMDRALALEPNSVEAALARAFYVYLVDVDNSRARELFEALDRRTPGDASIKAALAKIAQDEARWDEALALFTQALELDPNDRELRWDHAFLLSALLRFDEAAVAIDRGLRRFPDYAPLVALRAYHLMAQGRLDEAEIALAAPGEDAPSFDRLWARLQLLELQRRLPEQIRLLEAYRDRVEPSLDRVSLKVALSRGYDGVGRREEARQLMEQARADAEVMVAGDGDGSYAELILAVICAYQGDAVAARRHLEQPRDYWRRSGALGVGLYEEMAAEVELHLGNTEAALRHLQNLRGRPSDLTLQQTPQILQLDPRWDPLRQHPDFMALLAPLPR